MLTIPAQIPVVHPGLAATAAIAGLIPVLIHLINKRRHRRVRWAAMRFLFAARKENARRVWLEQWLLLLLRVALVLLFGFALARPYLASRAGFLTQSTRTHQVLLLDNSLSMQAESAGTSRFEKALEHATAWLDGIPRSDAVSVITLARPATALIDFAAYDRRLVRESLAGIELTQRATDVEGAVQLARDILKESPVLPQNRAVYVVSDFSKGAWGIQDAPEDVATTADTKAGRNAGDIQQSSPAIGGDSQAIVAIRQLAASLEEPAQNLRLTRIGGSNAGNVAITALRCDQPVLGSRFPARIDVTVENYAESAARALVVQLRRDGEVVRRVPVESVPPGASSTVSASILLSEPRTHLVEARLVGLGKDALALDDARYLSLEVRDTLPLLLVDGASRASIIRGTAGYLATALSPSLLLADSDLSAGATRIGARRNDGAGDAVFMAPRVIGPLELADEVLRDYEVIGLCDVRALPEETWAALARFVEQGGGLFISAGPQVDVEHYNEFAGPAGRGLIEAQLVRAVDRTSEPTSLSPDLLEHPVVLPFAGYASSGLFTAQFERYLGVASEMLPRHVVMAFRNGDPAMIVSRKGQGRVLTFLSTVNMNWNNLPAKGDFVSLMVSAFSYLSPLRGGERSVEVGDPLKERLTPAQSSLELAIRPPDGRAIPARLHQSDSGLALTFADTETAGAYQAQIGDASVQFAVNTSSAESDIREVVGATFMALLEGRATFSEDARIEPARTARAGELSFAMMLLVLVMLPLEMWAAYYFGSRRAA